MVELQRTDEWYADKLGCVGASRLSDVMAKGEGKTRESYLYELLAEIDTGATFEKYKSSAMEEGTEKEPLAKEFYQLLTFNKIVDTGFILHPTIKRFGASPDGLISKDGLIEIKCPLVTTFEKYRHKRKIDRKYMLQMQGQMSCTGRLWCDFVMFCPEMKDESKRMIITRVERDNETIIEIEKEVSAFISDLEALI
jgi:putative phage-type endonuclease